MSFYINNDNPNRPGPICGNQLNGICEKALIEVNKVFDACVCSESQIGIVLEASNFDPPGPAFPLTFISAETDLTLPTTVSNVTIERIDCKPNFANVNATVTIPVLIHYRDNNGISGTATSSFTLTKNVILYVPQPSLSPVSIKAAGLFASSIGVFTPETSFTVSACIQVILKVVAPVDLLVPTYGYPQIPPCQQATDSPICPGVGDLPIYPTALPNS